MFFNVVSDKYHPTVEEQHIKHYQTNAGPISMEVLDTAGAYQFPEMRKLAVRTGNAFVLVFSLADLKTFECLVGA